MAPFKTSILLLFLLVANNLVAQKPAATPQEAITYFFDGLSELSEAKMRTYITSDFLLLEDGEVWNVDSLTVNIARMKEREFKRINAFQFIRTDVKGNSATVAYHNHADITVNGQLYPVDWLESAQLVKEGRGWKIKLMHSTPIKPKKQ